MITHGPDIATTEPEPARRAADRRTTPAAGDVLASRRSARADVYAISIVPAERRTVAPRYSDAIRTVRELARQLRVDGWFTGDQTHYARIASYRVRPVR